MNAPFLLRLCCLLALAAPGASALAAEHAHHPHAAGASAGLQLDHGRKWATDAPLRAGMAHIQAAMAAQGDAIQGLSRAEYRKLADRLQQEVVAIVAACKLEPEADAMLHRVLADLGDGIGAMAGRHKKETPLQGARRVLGALDNYHRYFDHPGWKPLGH